MTTQTTTLIRAALDYAARGWHVIPLRPGTKRPARPNHTAETCDHSDPRCTSGHTNWETRATTDPTRIETAWTAHRSWGIGIACGPSHLVVIDLDTAKDGRPSGAESLARLTADAGEELPPTWVVTTPSGGTHHYYQHPEGGARLPNTAGRLGPGIDTRAQGGYVVAPPTALPVGAYTAGPPPDEVPTLPPWFSHLLTTNHPRGAEPGGRRQAPTAPPQSRPGVDGSTMAAYVEGAVSAELVRLYSIQRPGNRNQTLWGVAANLGQLVGAGAATETDMIAALEAVLPHLINLNQPGEPDPFTWTEGRRTIASGIARGRRRPRQLPTHLTETNQRKAS